MSLSQISAERSSGRDLVLEWRQARRVATLALTIAFVGTPTIAPAGVDPLSSPGARAADAAFEATVREGEAIFRDPRGHAPAFTGNALTCANCHLDDGRRANAAPMGAAYVRYPMYRAKAGHVVDFAERLQDCFRYSLNGTPPPRGDPVLVALETYAFSLAKGETIGKNVPGAGYLTLPEPPVAMDAARGAAVFSARCAICHGADGQGQATAGVPVFPALWGAASYNWGAGMVSVEKAAGFIKANMPFGEGYSLSDQKAWDVALFIDSHERPQDPRFTGDIEGTRAAYHADDRSMYGAVVDGVHLGAGTPRR